MLNSEKSKLPGAMAFYHEKGLVPAFTLASKYAGKDGHIGTMLDWVDARLNVEPYEKFGFYSTSNPTPWDQYYTTLSAEYVGRGKNGRMLLIVAHGIGPMATLGGAVAAYRHEFDDKTRRTDGGRISILEFLKLESGAYGHVEIVDLEQYNSSRKYPFIGYLHASEAFVDPVLRARLGPRAVEYIDRHATLARQYHAEEHKQAVTDPYVIEVGGPGFYWVEHAKLEEGLAYAHLLSVGCMSLSHHQSEYNVPSWVSDVTTHGWHDGTRFIGVRESVTTGIAKGPDAYDLLRKHWKVLMEPTGNSRPLPGNFYTLIQLPDETWFTQIHKSGGAMDNGEPEYLVTSIEPIGEPVRFFTEVHHYHGFFKYAKSEVQAVVPKEVNAYVLVGDPENIWKKGNPDQQTCLVQPYKVVIDHTKRLTLRNTLANDYGRMMELMSSE